MTDRTRALVSVLGLTVGFVSVVLVAAFGARWLLIRFAVASAWREGAILLSVSLVGTSVGFLLHSKALWAWVDWRRGWRVRWTGKKDRYAYEEYDDRGRLQSLEVGYEALENRYAPPCRITLPGASEWNAQTPAWAHGRRDVIVERLRVWGGGEGWEASVIFVSAATTLDESWR